MDQQTDSIRNHSSSRGKNFLRADPRFDKVNRRARMLVGQPIPEGKIARMTGSAERNSSVPDFTQPK